MSAQVTQQVDIQKRIGTEYWTNRYFLGVGSVGEAAGFVDEIVAFEKSIHSTEVIFDRARVSDGIPGTDSYVIIPLNGNGGVSGSGAHVPLFNTVRIDFGVGAGRPSRKYYRCGLGEGLMTGENWDNLLITDYQAAATAFVNGDVPYCDVDGQIIINATVMNQVQMRQLRRGSRKRNQPVI